MGPEHLMFADDTQRFASNERSIIETFKASGAKLNKKNYKGLIHRWVEK